MKAITTAQKFKLEKIDVTEPGRECAQGVRHPITITIDEISKIFMSMGYSIAEGPQAETVFHAFDALNSPPNHPSRDETDTFYFTDDIVLRPHTSSVQIRTLENQDPPIKVISPGRCFRCDTPDATHSPMFHQVEGLVIDRDITLGHLKGCLIDFLRAFFGIADLPVRFRSSILGSAVQARKDAPPTPANAHVANPLTGMTRRTGR